MKSNCIITFEGLNVNNFLNNLCKQNITVSGVEKRGRQCILQVSAIHSQKVVAQLKERCYNILDIRYTGAAFGLRFAKTHFVLIICMLLCIALIAAASQICLKIEVKGDYDYNLVCEALGRAGVKVGRSFVGFNPDVVENFVASNLDAMYAVVNRRGSVLYVNVVSAKQIDEPIDMSKRRDITATVSGVVTSALCEQGNLLVKVGDIVSVGDVLVEGRRVYNDGTSRDVYALGRITIRQTAEGKAEFSGYKTEMQKTGNSYCSVGVVLFGKEYGNTCKYDSYVKETSYSYLQPLNLALAHNTYYETREVTVGCTIGECMDELREQAYAEALKNCNFTPQDVAYSTEGGTVKATLIAITEIY